MGGIIRGHDVLESAEGRGGKVGSGDIPRGVTSLIPLTAAWVSPSTKPRPLDGRPKDVRSPFHEGGYL